MHHRVGIWSISNYRILENPRISANFAYSGEILSFAKRTSAGGFWEGLVFETNTISVVVRSGVRGERSNTSAPDLNTEKRLTRASAGTSS